HAEDRDLRHPRCAGGGLSRRSRPRHVGAAGPHQGDGRHALRQERQGHLSRQAVRRQGRRTVELGARGGDQGARGEGGGKNAPLAICALAWELVARLGLISSAALPPLSSVVVAWFDLLWSGDLRAATEVSLARGGAGLVLAIAVGAILGVAMAWWRPANALLS